MTDPKNTILTGENHAMFGRNMAVAEDGCQGRLTVITSSEHPIESDPESLDEVAESPSEYRRFYESISDRDQLALALCERGDWNDPEIADLVSRAATSLSGNGEFLRIMIGTIDEQQSEPRSSASQQIAAPS